MDFKEIGIDGANWIQLAQDRVQWWTSVSTVMNLRVP
jgi:hypothetical protein